MGLDELRKNIDDIDDEIAELFCRRMKTVAAVTEWKRQNNAAVYSGSREDDILSRVSAACGDELASYARVLFSTMFELSRSYQESALPHEGSKLFKLIESAERCGALPENASVACQGTEGAYSQQACLKLFPSPDITFFQSFEDVFRAVDSGECQYGLLPIENSSAGSVISVYNLMNRYNFYIVQGVRLKIDHCLLAPDGVAHGDIREVVSHEQALAQCSGFLRKNPQIKVTVFENTATAAKYVAESGRRDIAAIAAPICSQLYGLNVLAEKLQDSDHNFTRFICISKTLGIYPGANKITFIATLPHSPGALYGLISKFAHRGINISKIESRPIPGKDFEFIFYFDVEAPIDDTTVQGILIQLENEGRLTFLGGYPEKS